MIKTFKDKRTQDIYNGFIHRSLPSDILRAAKRKLQMLDAAYELKDLKIPPANRLEVLKGNRKGQLSIRINVQWRICFIWKDGSAYDVEIVDYH